MNGIILLAGGGGASIGIASAGVTVAGAVEIRPDVAAVYRVNCGDHVEVAPVEDTDPARYTGVDLIQASPTCTRASVANPTATEAPADRAVAEAIIRYVEVIRPRYFWLENVTQYTRFSSYRAILAALDRLDYWIDVASVNAADYGVPQTRQRLIVRAVAGGFMQPARPLPAPGVWRGWFSAVEDLIPGLPEMPPGPNDKNLALYNGTPKPDRWDWLLADLKNRNHRQGECLTLRPDYAPAITLVATGRPDLIRLVSRDGRWLRSAPRAWARWQSIPDWYALPDDPLLACRIIGNSVPPRLAEVITRSMIG